MSDTSPPDFIDSRNSHPEAQDIAPNVPDPEELDLFTARVRQGRQALSPGRQNFEGDQRPIEMKDSRRRSGKQTERVPHDHADRHRNTYRPHRPNR